MPKRRGGDPTPPTALTRPLATVRQEMDAQIEVGNALAKRGAATPQEFDALNQEYEGWRDYCLSMLRACFNDFSMWREYDWAVPVENPAHQTGSVEHRAQTLRDIITMRTRKLESIRQRLHLFEPADAPQAAASPSAPPARPYATIHVNNSPQAHVTIQGTDVSSSSIDQRRVFAELRAAVEGGVSGDARGRILASLDELEAAKPATFLEKYKDFMAVAADHMTLIAPLIPALTKLLGG